MVCADEVSRGTPDPEGYLTAARRRGVDPGGCLVIEDAPAGLGAARAGGMRSIGITTTHSEDELQGADAITSSLDRLHVTIDLESRLRVEVDRG